MVPQEVVHANSGMAGRSVTVQSVKRANGQVQNLLLRYVPGMQDAAHLEGGLQSRCHSGGDHADIPVHLFVAAAPCRGIAHSCRLCCFWWACRGAATEGPVGASGSKGACFLSPQQHKADETLGGQLHKAARAPRGPIFAFVSIAIDCHCALGPAELLVCSRLTCGLAVAKAVCASAGAMGKPADENEELEGTTRLQQTKLGDLGMTLCSSNQVHLRTLHC